MQFNLAAPISSTIFVIPFPVIFIMYYLNYQIYYILKKYIAL